MGRVNRHRTLRVTTSLLLICAGATGSSRSGGFPAPDEPLDDGGRRAAAACAIPARFHGHVATSPARAARETAAAMGLDAREEAALADVGYGAWAGRSLADVHAADAGGLAAWLAAPEAGTPGGESLAAAAQRVSAWLDPLQTAAGPVCAITHAGIIRAALAHALAIPFAATLAIDLAPLSRTQLSFNRIWRLQALMP